MHPGSIGLDSIETPRRDQAFELAPIEQPGIDMARKRRQRRIARPAPGNDDLHRLFPDVLQRGKTIADGAGFHRKVRIRRVDARRQHRHPRPPSILG